VFDRVNLEEAGRRGAPVVANVRTEMLRRMAAPPPLRRLLCPSIFKRVPASRRSMVTTETAKTLSLTIGSRSR
jgi:hypothetical protein